MEKNFKLSDSGIFLCNLKTIEFGDIFERNNFCFTLNDFLNEKISKITIDYQNINFGYNINDYKVSFDNLYYSRFAFQYNILATPIFTAKMNDNSELYFAFQENTFLIPKAVINYVDFKLSMDNLTTKEILNFIDNIKDEIREQLLLSGIYQEE